MSTLVFQATLGGQINMVGADTASTFTITVPAVTGNIITSGDTATVTSTMISGPVTTAKGGTGLASFTANGVVYASSTSALTTGSALVFDGTNLGVGASPSYAVDIRNASSTALRVGSSGNAYGSLLSWDNTAGLGKLWTLGAYDFVFGTNSTERARIDSSGQVGIGFTPLSTQGNLQVYKLVSGGAPATSGTTDANQVFAANGSSVQLSYGVFASGAGWIQQRSSGSFSTNYDLAIQPNGGNLLVGTTTTAAGQTGFTVISPASNPTANLFKPSGSGSGSAYFGFYYNAGLIGSITQNGTTAVAYNTSSDYRLKNITGPITNSGAYIDSLNPVEGTWKADGSTFVGLIAHEVQEASRTTVATGVKDGEEMQGMDYSSSEIIANMIAELKSLRARVAQLKGKA